VLFQLVGAWTPSETEAGSGMTQGLGLGACKQSYLHPASFSLTH